MTVTEYGRAFDTPLPDDDVILWSPNNDRLFGPCPERGTINGHSWHRVKRTVTYSEWVADVSEAL